MLENERERPGWVILNKAGLEPAFLNAAFMGCPLLGISASEGVLDPSALARLCWIIMEFELDDPSSSDIAKLCGAVVAQRTRVGLCGA